ncbi:MAG: helix-turn-helix domain-containing protein [bacterium]|nr:helix-turn-helix domain-containing protein [bacterium]
MEASEIMIFLFLVCSIQGIISSIFFIISGVRQNSTKFYWGALILIFSIILFSWVGFWTGYIFTHRYLIGWGDSFVFLIGPAVYFLTKEKKPSKQFILHSIPFLLNIALVTWRVTLGEKSYLPEQVLPLIPSILLAFEIIHLTVYGTLIFHYRYTREKLSFRQFDTAIGAFLAFYLGYTGYFITFYFIEYVQWIDFVIAIVMSVFFYYIVYRTHSGFLKETMAQKYSSSSLTLDDSNYIYNKILDYLGSSNASTDPTFDLDKLSSEIKVPKYRISQTLSVNNESFHDLINRKRVNEAMDLLTSKSHDHYTLEAIGETVGFKNRMSFYNYFKKETGITPGIYKQQKRSQMQSAI